MSAAHAGTLKSPPYLVHSEKAVLGTILAHPPLLKEVRGIVRDGSAFFKDHHARVYKILIELDDEHGAFDLDQVMEEARRTGMVSDAVGTGPIDGLVAAAVAPAAALEHARQIQDKALMRELIDVVSDILYDASKSTDRFAEVLARAQGKLSALARRDPAFNPDPDPDRDRDPSPPDQSRPGPSP